MAPAEDYVFNTYDYNWENIFNVGSPIRRVVPWAPEA